MAHRLTGTRNIRLRLSQVELANDPRWPLSLAALLSRCLARRSTIGRIAVEGDHTIGAAELLAEKDLFVACIHPPGERKLSIAMMNVGGYLIGREILCTLNPVEDYWLWRRPSCLQFWDRHRRLQRELLL